MQMIERAIRELNEEGGGSTEESISNFIRKEYDDLPWSHTTLLNHHLLELCKCGNVFLTCDQRYSLVNANSSVNSSKKCSRKRKRRNRDWVWDIRQRKLHNKCIRAKRLLRKKDQIHEKYNIEAETKKDIQQLSITRQDMDQIEDDQIEISMPERPLGFHTETFEESSHFPLCCTENPSMAEGLSEHKEEQISVDKTWQLLQPTTRTSGIDSQCIPKKEEDPPMSSQKGSVALHSQKLLPKSELTDNATAVSESRHVNLGRGERACRIIFKYHRRHTAQERIISCRIENRKEEHSDGNAIGEPSFLQQHRQEHEFLHSNCILALPVFLEEATDSKKINSEIEFQLQTSKNRAKRRVFSQEEHPLQNDEQPKYNLRSRYLIAKPSEGDE